MKNLFFLLLLLGITSLNAQGNLQENCRQLKKEADEFRIESEKLMQLKKVYAESLNDFIKYEDEAWDNYDRSDDVVNTIKYLSIGDIIGKVSGATAGFLAGGWAAVVISLGLTVTEASADFAVNGKTDVAEKAKEFGLSTGISTSAELVELTATNDVVKKSGKYIGSAAGVLFDGYLIAKSAVDYSQVWEDLDTYEQDMNVIWGNAYDQMIKTRQLFADSEAQANKIEADYEVLKYIIREGCPNNSIANINLAKVPSVKRFDKRQIRLRKGKPEVKILKPVQTYDYPGQVFCTNRNEDVTIEFKNMGLFQYQIPLLSENNRNISFSQPSYQRNGPESIKMSFRMNNLKEGMTSLIIGEDYRLDFVYDPDNTICK